VALRVTVASGLILPLNLGAIMARLPDLRKHLSTWPYDPDDNVLLVRGKDGRQIILVRQLMGLEQYEVEGRPDGQRSHGMKSSLEFQLARLEAAKTAGLEERFRLSAATCEELFQEGMMYYYRFLNFCRLKKWARAERDTSRNLRLIELVRKYAEHEEDRAQFEQWQVDVSRLNAISHAMTLLRRGKHDQALKSVHETIGEIADLARDLDGSRPDPEKMAATLLEGVRESLVNAPTLRPREESVFVKQGDYWTIQYQREIARLKGGRGLHWLACLLRHPGREFHVSELIAELADILVAAAAKPAGRRESGIGATTTQAQSSGPILDARAKAEYRRRIQVLREKLEEAERFDDPERAARVQDEMNSIAEQLAAAVGLGGRDRKTGSEAERARSAVTKRIKESINKIAEVIPSLGRHLAVRIKTGYFCSYNPHPNRPVAWKF
jgi:hypothetical protein